MLACGNNRISYYQTTKTNRKINECILNAMDSLLTTLNFFLSKGKCNSLLIYKSFVLWLEVTLAGFLQLLSPVSIFQAPNWIFVHAFLIC